MSESGCHENCARCRWCIHKFAYFFQLLNARVQSFQVENCLKSEVSVCQYCTSPLSLFNCVISCLTTFCLKTKLMSNGTFFYTICFGCGKIHFLFVKFSGDAGSFCIQIKKHFIKPTLIMSTFMFSDVMFRQFVLRTHLCSAVGALCTL